MDKDLPELSQQLLTDASAFLAALDVSDVSALEGMMTSDMVFEVPFAPPGFVKRTEGRDNVLALVAAARDGFLDGPENLYDIDLDVLQNKPGTVIGTYKSRMKLRSGVTYTNEYIAKIEMTGGKVSHFTEYLDSIPLLIAMGGSVTSPQNFS